MKKIIPFLLLTLSLPLSSCTTMRKEEKVASFSSPFYFPLPSDESRIKLKDDKFITPFNTSLSANLYYYDDDFSDEQLSSIKEDFTFEMEFAHALSDRHYSYTLDGKDLVNVKTINESYGFEKPVAVDDYLFDLLKLSFDFTLQSKGKFNMFLGKLNDIYENKLAMVKSLDGDRSASLLDYVLMDTTGLRFSSFSKAEKEQISSISEQISSISDFKDVLSFDEEKKTVTFHSVKDEKGDIIPLSISLGGNAKGYFTQYFCERMKEKYPNSCFLLNSGSSSIKAINKRPDDLPWIIRYINPCYQERIDREDSQYHNYEVLLSVDSSFNISTSGYYENYFYEFQDGQFLRRNHILNPQTGFSESYFDQVSVLLEDCALADMYTTALMNTSSLQEAKDLFSSLNEKYDQKDASLILCVKEREDKPFSFSMDCYSPLNEKNLPLVTLKDKTIYQGDYTDLSYQDIRSFDSKLSLSFQESIYVSSDIYDSCRIDDKIKETVSVIKKL